MSTAASSPIPFKTVTGADAPVGGVGWLPVLLCVGAVFLLVFLHMRKGRSLSAWSGRKKDIQVVESVRLGERERLSVVHYRGRALLVAHGGPAATVLANDPIEPQAQESVS
jgi:flagellar biogenesis protein FliO